MALTAGTRLGQYEIHASIGTGGMGEVYRARDTKLGRDVAIKFLPDLSASDPERLARFEREAKTLASLNHPHIAQIYGFEESGGLRALVMELVPGRTLAEMLADGALPVADALPIAAQIAEALEAAHEQGIIHRDLKPANVKVRDDGTVKVLDFGLAKALDPLVSSYANPTDSPTMTSLAMTQMGVILGTAAYMSPEQAKGRPVDKRADIWAFGSVLYEMLTGRTLFGGETASEILAAVIKDEPSLDRLPGSVPSSVRRLLARCLERDPRLRLRDIGEARISLAQPGSKDEIADSATAQRAPGRLIWRIALGAVALAAAVGAIVWRAKPAVEVPVRRFELPAATEFALAPDGSRISYFADGRLYVRAFDTIDAQDLGPVPPASTSLFWSPDSATIGYASEGKIRRIPAAGGPMFEICKIPSTGRLMGVAWRTDGTIVFSIWRDHLYRVSAAGGAPELFLRIDQTTEIDFHSVSALRDNRVVVATHLREGESSYRVELIDAGGSRRTVLISNPSIQAVQYVRQGYLLFRRFGANQGIWAVPFGDRPLDLAKAELIDARATAFAGSNDATLALLLPASRSKSELVWRDRAGRISPIAGDPFEQGGSAPALSPDGRRAVFIVTPQSGSGSYVVVRDLETGRDSRLTFPETEQDRQRVSGARAVPAWFPSGDRVVYSTGVIESETIVTRMTDGTGDARELTAGSFARVSPDGRQLLYVVDDRGRRRFRHATLSSDGVVGPAQRLFSEENEPNVSSFDLSPDGSVLAYAVVQPNDQLNVFLTQFPTGSGRWQVTADGGTRPRFSRDGRELFYVSGDRSGSRGQPRGKFMAVPVTLHPTVKIGAAAELFAGQASGSNLVWYDVAKDGRFLMSRSLPPAAGDAHRLILVQNWLATLK